MNLENEQSEKLAKIRRIMQDNLDLSYEFVRQLLIAQAEVAAGKAEPFEFDIRHQLSLKIKNRCHIYI